MERVLVERGGAHAVKAVTGSFALQKLRFSAEHRISWFEPEWGYIALVLDGAMQKQFANDAWSLDRDGFATLPAGAGHRTAFGIKATHVLTVSPRSDDTGVLFARFLSKRSHISAPAAAALGRRIVCELDAPDASSELATEGLVLQLLAMGQRESVPARQGRSRLANVAEILRARTPGAPTLTALAAEVGVHPAHLARCFRQEFGVAVGEYSRMLRLEWAAARLKEGTPLAQVALEAGFADQSHFTRAFRRQFGVTPGRYRELLRR